ncbi:hypothetical protein ANN_25421 [Periplaneta americana]|uniref:Reverse transcriptase domain-containing protein n=1 Tax=Periplaneta americana TaxID=6978 RepID=A0ABQ8S1A1_PERAM|nr:hypothetical protein ANN_25421 [Periplaneta americana]
MYPEIPLPPKPILTRWGTWLEAVEYYAEHIDSINNVLLALDSEDAVSIDTAKTNLELQLSNRLSIAPAVHTCGVTAGLAVKPGGPAREGPRPTSRLLASRPHAEAEVDDHPTRMDVSCGSHGDPPAVIAAGVPQGSVLAPHLYSVYVHDIPLIAECNMGLYADDTTYFTSDISINIAQRTMQKQLKVLEMWLRNWRIKVNISKTQAIIFTRRKPKIPDHLNLFSEDIYYKQSVKYLGVTLDKQLRFHHHVQLSEKIQAAAELWRLTSRPKVSMLFSHTAGDLPVDLEILQTVERKRRHHQELTAGSLSATDGHLSYRYAMQRLEHFKDDVYSSVHKIGFEETHVELERRVACIAPACGQTRNEFMLVCCVCKAGSAMPHIHGFFIWIGYVIKLTYLTSVSPVDALTKCKPICEHKNSELTIR